MQAGRGRRPNVKGLVVVACGVCLLSVPAIGQDEPGDQVLSFGFSQKFEATDNIRLDTTSAGTTSYSDTGLTFNFSNQTGPQSIEFGLRGVIRLIDDPVSGTDSGFRDPGANLSYVREGANSRLSVLLDYARPDLAFLDPLEQEVIDDQDLFRGGGTREDYLAQILLETGLQAPLGFLFDVNTRQRSYSDTTDPLLFSNQTDTAAVTARLRLSPVTNGRLNLSQQFYSAQDAIGTDRRTSRLTFALDHALTPASVLTADFGFSRIVETFNTLPGVEDVTSDPVGGLTYVRDLPNGSFRTELNTTASQVGRQTTFDFGRTIELPRGAFSFSLGASTGDTFDVQPIGDLSYTAELPNGTFSAVLSRTVTISDTLSQAEATTRADLAYQMDINALSSLDFTFYYADIEAVRAGFGDPGRTRASFGATYSRDVTEDWEFQAGYRHQYFDSSTTDRARSDSLFVTLQRNFDTFR